MNTSVVRASCITFELNRKFIDQQLYLYNSTSDQSIKVGEPNCYFIVMFSDGDEVIVAANKSSSNGLLVSDIFTYQDKYYVFVRIYQLIEDQTFGLATFDGSEYHFLTN